MIDIRDETPGDAAAIAIVNRLAFGGDVEVRLIDRLRRDGDIVASLVAVVDGAVVGHVLFSRLPIETDEGRLEAVALAPAAVHPDHQKAGIGSALIRRGLDLCTAHGAVAAVVLGHPAYYRRFGFSSELARQLDAPYAGSDAFMAIELVPASLSGVAGRACYAAAFADLG